MTPELTVLTLAGLLQGLQFALVSVRANMELPAGKTMGPRDPDRLGKPIVEQVSPRTGRLFRAMNNHFEALIMFTLAVVVVTLGDKATGLSAACAWTFLAARIAYIPAYYFGLTPWRSIIWMFGFLATMLMLISALF
ncbi:MAPEG family protein [Loktanella sp. R86503]|uniref:MAPEG family protein n=1 Tax=Loktanella sp. R86503 TaxID=3093847 RepID=UPI0036DC7DFB